MARFTKGDRVYIRDRDPVTLDTPYRERLATVIEQTAHSGNGRGTGSLTYLVSVAGFQSDPTEVPHPVPIAEDLLEPAGSLGERYGQVVGPFTDFVTMWTRALRVRRSAPLPPDVDIIGVNWPEWFLIVEIRGTGVEVPLVRDHPEWRWHMARLGQEQKR